MQFQIWYDAENICLDLHFVGQNDALKCSIAVYYSKQIKGNVSNCTIWYLKVVGL